VTSIAIAYHSGFGHTAAVAASVHRGAGAVDGVRATLIDVAALPPPDERRRLTGLWDELHAADAIIFGCPTYMGTVSGVFKQFMDASGAVWQSQAWRDKMAAGFTNAGGLSGDKLNTLTTLAMFAAQHSMIWVSQGVFVEKSGINRMGSWIGMMAQSSDGPIETSTPPEDHETARRFGERVALAAVRWVGQPAPAAAV
jgi:multimeric flavodoxin WrbA